MKKRNKVKQSLSKDGKARIFPKKDRPLPLPGPKPYPCSECPKSFSRPQQRDIHMTVHTGEKNFLCPDCGNSFGSASTLIDHRKRKHLEMRDHKCADCPKGFFTRQELEAHVRTHTGDRPFLCKVRDNLKKNIFKKILQLSKHIEISI